MGAAGVWTWLGRTRFEDTVRLQETVASAVIRGEGPETLLFCEHDPVITLGRGAHPEHLLVSREELARKGVAVHPASRGGDVTYHGPGQLVGYPIFRLRQGVVAHFEMMAAGIVSGLAKLGIRSEWRRSSPGVWVGDEKICAFGVHVRHRVTSHGFALNVSTELDAFDLIVPCGVRGCRVTSIARLAGSAPALATLAEETAAAFARSFAIDLRNAFAKYDLTSIE